MRISSMFANCPEILGILMSAMYLEALAGIAISLSILMGIAWTVRQRTGNAGRMDTIWTFSAGAGGAGRYQPRTGMFCPRPPGEAAP
jgi:hypothetical protein